MIKILSKLGSKEDFLSLSKIYIYISTTKQAKPIANVPFHSKKLEAF